MKRIAIIKKCEQSDIDPDRPKSEQQVCLYAHPKTSAEEKKGHGRLLGRHPNEEAAQKQERAIRAKQSMFMAYVAEGLIEHFSSFGLDPDIFTACAESIVTGSTINTANIRLAFELANIRTGSTTDIHTATSEVISRARYLFDVAEQKNAEITADNEIKSNTKYTIWWDGSSEEWIVSNKDDSVVLAISGEKHDTAQKLIELATNADLPGNPTEKDFSVIPFSGDIVSGSFFMDKLDEIYEAREEAKREAAGWEGEPEGWTNKSKKEFWDSLGGSVEKCIEKVDGAVDDPGAFCASLADEIEGTDWRKGPRKGSKETNMRKVETIVVGGVKYREVNGATVTEKVKEFFKSLLQKGSEEESACNKQAANVIELPTECVEEVIGVAFSKNPNTVFEKKQDTWLVDGVDSNGVIDDPLIQALVSYCEMDRTATNHFSRLNPDDFMRPDVINDTFYLIVDEHGETAYIPAEYIDSKDAEQAMRALEDGDTFDVTGTSIEDFVMGSLITEMEEATGWFARLSAPGYLDATEWSGPFESEDEATEYLDEMYGDDDYIDEDEYGLPPDEK